MDLGGAPDDWNANSQYRPIPPDVSNALPEKDLARNGSADPETDPVEAEYGPPRIVN